MKARQNELKAKHQHVSSLWVSNFSESIPRSNSGSIRGQIWGQFRIIGQNLTIKSLKILISSFRNLYRSLYRTCQRQIRESGLILIFAEAIFNDFFKSYSKSHF